MISPRAETLSAIVQRARHRAFMANVSRLDDAQARKESARNLRNLMALHNHVADRNVVWPDEGGIPNVQ